MKPRKRKMSAYLPVEVILEILRRLPVKCLVRCRSVCKTWNSLITNPSFISTHLQTSLSKPHTHLLVLPVFPKGPENYALHFYNDDFREINRLPFPGKDLRRYFQVGGSCNGLVFLCSPYPSSFSNLIFWNPSIHKYITLPNPSINRMSHNDYFICGFGFDSRINDYKLLKVVVENETLGEAYLFSLNENSWKRVSAISPKYAVDDINSSTFVNGTTHWVGYQIGEDEGYRNTILGFDMSTEEFLVIGLPESLIDSFPGDLSIMKYEESSIAVLKRNWEDGEPLDLWVMKEYGAVRSWTKVFDFTEQSESIESVLGFIKNAEVLLELGDGEIASLDLKSQQMEHLGIEVAATSFVDSYVESLVLLDK